MADSDFGTDVSTLGDLDPTFTAIYGKRVVLERLVRRLTTARQVLAYAPDDGLDVTSWSNDAVSRAQRAALGNYMLAEVQKDEAVLSAQVSIIGNAESLAASVSVDTDEGPFAFMLPIGDVTAARLANSR